MRKMLFVKYFRDFITKGNKRTLNAKRNIIYSFFIKGISIGISLLMVPITIDYLDPSMYGVWLTLSSILSWIVFFDIGFSQGLRNRFAEAIAKNDYEKARSYVSTTYFALSLIVLTILILALIINHYINWCDVLNVNSSYNSELRNVFNILLIFFCLQMILKIITTVMLADQKTALASSVDTLGQFFNLVIIFILTKTTSGSLKYLATAISVTPCIVLLIFSIICYSKRYHRVRPSYRYVNFSDAKSIINLGGRFFIIQVSQILVFQCTNVIISHLEGPENVTIYNVTYKYFSVFNMLMTILITPFWSAFTEAYAKDDYAWMINIYRKLTKMWFLIAGLIILFLIISPWIFTIWLNNQVEVPFVISAALALYTLLASLGGISITLLNGIGKVSVQMYIHLFFAIITIPILIYTIKNYELLGGILFLSINPLVHLIFSRKQLSLILKHKAYGVWRK